MQGRSRANVARSDAQIMRCMRTVGSRTDNWAAHAGSGFLQARCREARRTRGSPRRRGPINTLITRPALKSSAPGGWYGRGQVPGDQPASVQVDTVAGEAVEVGAAARKQARESAALVRLSCPGPALLTARTSVGSLSVDVGSQTASQTPNAPRTRLQHEAGVYNFSYPLSSRNTATPAGSSLKGMVMPSPRLALLTESIVFCSPTERAASFPCL